MFFSTMVTVHTTKQRIWIAIGFSLAYLIAGILTHQNYGANWDESIHFNRGQAFLHFYLTGKTDYTGLLPIDKTQYRVGFGHESTDPETGAITRQTIYKQTPFSSYTTQMQLRNGHPALSDIMASVFNTLLFQKLGWVDDVHAYNYYMVVIAAIAVGFIFYWTSGVFGVLAGIGAAISLFLYPLFLAESHYNIKDVPEAVFYACTLLLFYSAFIHKSSRMLLWSAVMCGLSFATKFNILFAPFIVVPWLICFFVVMGKARLKRFIIDRRFLMVLFLFPVIMLVIWVISFPRFWYEPKLLVTSFDYYLRMGTSGKPEWKLYPVLYVIFKTPGAILFFTIVTLASGTYALLKKGKRRLYFFNTPERRLAFILLAIWLIVPVLRVSLPSMSIYGGSRQIMEYVPALAILSGIGFALTYSWILQIVQTFLQVKTRFLSAVIFTGLIAVFIPVVRQISSLYPNEGTYYNELIGGLKGAQRLSIPDAGNTLGNPYLAGVRWINEHAEKNARVALGYELMANIPYIWFRNDIQFSNSYRSGPAREGEYIIMVYDELIYNKWYPVRYLRNELIPIYTVESDGVPLLSVWKNEKKYIKPAFQDMKEITAFKSIMGNDSIIIEFSPPVNLMRIYFDGSFCPAPGTEVGEFRVYEAASNKSHTRTAIISEFYDKMASKEKSPGNYFLFASEGVRRMKFTYEPEYKRCFLQIKSFNVFGVENPN